MVILSKEDIRKKLDNYEDTQFNTAWQYANHRDEFIDWIYNLQKGVKK